MPEHGVTEEELGDPTLQEERKGTLERTAEEGVGGLVKGLGSMLLPQAGLPGKRGLGNILNDFVEFSALGDIGDVGAAIDPNSGLDWLERLIAASPFLGVGAIGTHVAYKRYQTRADQALPAPSLNPAPGQGYDFELGFEDLGGAKATAEQTRQQAAHFEQLALEADSPFSQATLRADTWENLSAAVIPGSAVESTVKRAEDVLRQLGAAVMGLASDPKLYGSEFVAAKVAITKWNRAVELGLLENPSGRTSKTRTMMDLLDKDSIDNVLKIAQLEAATWMVGPDLVLPSPARLSSIWFDENEVSVAYVMVDGLLPTERGWDYDARQPADAGVLRRRQQQLDLEGVQGVGATHVAQGLLDTPPHAVDNAGGLEATTRQAWYFKFNATSNALAETTPYTVEQVSGILGALSANTPWNDNLVGAIHVILQTGRPDLQPGTAAYVDAFKAATIKVGWGYDLFEDATTEVQAQFEQMPQAPGGIPDVTGLVEQFADPQNVTSPEGNLVGASDQVKKDKIDMILKANLPPWIVLRGMKTNTFSQLGADPTLVDLVTVDVHVDRQWWGTRWVDTPLAHQGYTPGEGIKADQTYHDPLSGDTVSGQVILDGLETLASEHGWTKTQVKQWTRLLSTFPNKQQQARFLAQARSHLLVRDEFGLEAGHQAQAGAWGTARENWGSLRKELDDARTKEEVQEIAERGVLSDTLMTHLDGNPSMELTAAGMLWEVSDRIPQKLPRLKDLLRAKKGMQRPASARSSGAIIAVTGADGTIAVYADTSVNGVSETLRHTTRTGVMVGKYELHIASTPREVMVVQDHFVDTAEYLREDGRKAAGHQTLVLDPGGPGHPGSRPGDTAVVLLPEDMLPEAQKILRGDHAFDQRVVRAQGTVTAASRNKLIAEDLEGLTDSQLGEVLENNDWVAMSAFKDDATDGTNWNNQRLLKLDIEQAGGSVDESMGMYGGVGEPSFFVTGMTYQDAYRLGKKYNQESIATRNGLVYMDSVVDGVKVDGTYHPTLNEASFGEAADPNAHTVLSTGQRFSFQYDFGDTRPLPDDLDTLADGDPTTSPLSQLTIGMGGQYGGATWNITDRILKKLAAIPGARVRFYTHSQNKIPAGYASAVESVVTDATGITGSTLHKGGDSYARHQNVVYVPEWEVLTLSEDGFGAERARRSTTDIDSILEINQEVGEIWIDKDLLIQVDPSSDVTMADKGSLFRSLKVDGKLVRELSVDTNGPIPTLIVGLDNIPAPGLTVVQLSNGKVTKITPHAEGDWTAAKDALTSAGLIPEGEAVDVVYPEESKDLVDSTTPRVYYDDKTGLTPARGRKLVESVPTPEDIDLVTRLQEFLPNLPKASLGANAHPELRVTLEATLEGLHGLSNRYPGVKLVGALDESVWNNSSGIDTMHIINAPLTDALSFFSAKGGIVLNERQIVVRWNQGAKAATKPAMVRPESMSDFEATLVHEMGHLVSRKIPMVQRGQLVTEAMDELGGRATGFLRLSEYGMTKHDEFIAEAFVEVMANGENAHPALVNLVRKVMDFDS